MTEKKKYKIIKTELFKEQEKKLPKKVKEELAKALKNITKNPEKCPNSMNLFGEPSPEELKQWMGRTKASTIDLVLEYLDTKGCLKKNGVELYHKFWEKYVKEK